MLASRADSGIRRFGYPRICSDAQSRLRPSGSKTRKANRPPRLTGAKPSGRMPALATEANQNWWAE
jgi:hypothetical protein